MLVAKLLDHRPDAGGMAAAFARHAVEDSGHCEAPSTGNRIAVYFEGAPWLLNLRGSANTYL
jgi:hypothetical protein